jgi:hypothetical protein
MNKLIYKGLIALFFLSSCASLKKASPPEGRYYRYGVESGIIEYSLTGTQEGKETIYFKDWGMIEAKYTDTKITFQDSSENINSLTIINNDSVFFIDLNKKTGIKLENKMLKEMADSLSTKDLGLVGESMIKDQMKGRKTGTEKILGKKCDVWETTMPKGKTWIWKNITLKLTFNMMGMKAENTATKIKTGVEIPPEKFIAPPGIKLEEPEKY